MPTPCQRRARAAAAVIPLVLALAACGSHPSPVRSSSTQRETRTPRPLSLLIVGDSITAGWYASTPDHDYRSLVVQALDRRAAPTSSFVGAAGDRSVDVTPEVTNERFDLVVVEIGTNDALKLPLDRFPADYRALLLRIRHASPHAPLLCLGVWQAAEVTARFDPVVRSTCAAEHGIFVPLGTLFAQTANRGPAGRRTTLGAGDDFHPNDAGHARIADRVLAALGPFIGETGPVDR